MNPPISQKLEYIKNSLQCDDIHVSSFINTTISKPLSAKACKRIATLFYVIYNFKQKYDDLTAMDILCSLKCLCYQDIHNNYDSCMTALCQNKYSKALLVEIACIGYEKNKSRL